MQRKPYLHEIECNAINWVKFVVLLPAVRNNSEAVPSVRAHEGKELDVMLGRFVWIELYQREVTLVRDATFIQGKIHAWCPHASKRLD